MSYLCVKITTTRCKPTRPARRGLLRATRLFERFHRYPPNRITVQRCERRIPKVLVKLGRLRALIYSSDRGRPGCARSFIHRMRTPPLLACDVRGRRLFLLGGKYRVTPFGIVG